MTAVDAWSTDNSKVYQRLVQNAYDTRRNWCVPAMHIYIRLPVYYTVLGRIITQLAQQFIGICWYCCNYHSWVSTNHSVVLTVDVFICNIFIKPQKKNMIVQQQQCVRVYGGTSTSRRQHETIKIPGKNVRIIWILQTVRTYNVYLVIHTYPLWRARAVM